MDAKPILNGIMLLSVIRMYGGSANLDQIVEKVDELISNPNVDIEASVKKLLKEGVKLKHINLENELFKIPGYSEEEQYKNEQAEEDDERQNVC